MTEDLRMSHDPDSNRYEIFVGGTVAGFAEYEVHGSTITFTHTFTSSRFRDRGLAARVVQFALDDARKDRMTVVPQCWYVAQFIDEHPEYANLLG